MGLFLYSIGSEGHAKISSILGVCAIYLIFLGDGA